MVAPVKEKGPKRGTFSFPSRAAIASPTNEQNPILQGRNQA